MSDSSSAPPSGDAAGNDVPGPVRTRREVLAGAGFLCAAAFGGLTVSACSPPGIAVPVGEVPVGGGKILSDAGYVVTQPAPGEYRAFGKNCTHAMCPVTSVADGKIVCACHGSVFSAQDGSVLTGPATKPLREATVTVSGDELRVTA